MTLSKVLADRAITPHSIRAVQPLPRFAKKLEQVLLRNPGSYCTIACMGDSGMAGIAYGTPAGNPDAPYSNGARDFGYIARMAHALRAMGIPVCDDAVVGWNLQQADTVANYNAYNSRLVVDAATWAAGGTASWGGPTFRKASATPGPLTFTPHMAHAYLDIIYLDNSGAYTVGCDGAPVLTFATTGETVPKLISTPVQAEGNHVWTIDTTSAATANIVAIIPRSIANPRVDVLLAAGRGRSMVDAANVGVYNGYGPWRCMPLVTIDLLINGFGINDVRTGGGNASVGLLQSAMTTLLALAPNADKILISPNEISPANDAGTGAHMSDLFALYESTAASQRLNHVSVRDIAGKYALVNAMGRMMADGLHFNERDIARAIGEALSATIVAGVRVAGLPF